MPRNLLATTFWSAAWEDSNVDRTCPGEYELADHPEVHHVITRRLDEAAVAAYLAEHDIELRPGQVVGSVPARMSPDGYLISTLETDPDILTAFGDEVAPDEQLGTVPAAERPAILLTAAELGDVIDERHRGPGDVLFHREGLPRYDVPSQNADREAWVAGRFDPGQVTAWSERLADERARGMVSRRLRILSADLTDDEQMSVFGALPVIGREEEVRILRRGEHAFPTGLIEHDYWIARPADGPVLVVRMRYTDGGAFEGAVVVAPQDHGPYLRDQELLWEAGMSFTEWTAAHGDLRGRAA